MDEQYKNEILTSTLEGRRKEITEYQVNIDNFTLAIEEIGDDPLMQDFKAHLQKLLTENQAEQRKCQFLYNVVDRQLNGGSWF